ncbi:uncharacterized protein [Dermacentor andersoni]|uniref:uncharacterized protein n=1 Tax=Dermacentor andersoni TaxID=34620 RepID=UPI003B3BAC10
MSSPRAKRYRRYLEPERSRYVPRQTRHNQRVRQGDAAHADGVSESSSASDERQPDSPTCSDQSTVADVDQLDEDLFYCEEADDIPQERVDLRTEAAACEGEAGNECEYVECGNRDEEQADDFEDQRADNSGDGQTEGPEEQANDRDEEEGDDCEFSGDFLEEQANDRDGEEDDDWEFSGDFLEADDRDVEEDNYEFSDDFLEEQADDRDEEEGDDCDFSGDFLEEEADDCDEEEDDCEFSGDFPDDSDDSTTDDVDDDDVRQFFENIRERVNAEWCDITVTINTDGSPVFKSSKYSVWPIQILVNELPFDIRFCNIVVGALWFAKCHPPAHLFMLTFVKVFNNMNTISWQHAGERINSKVFVTCCCVDSPARASLLNMKQFNGFYGCSWCLEKGTAVERTLRYIPGESAAALRTHRGMVQDMQDAYEQGRPVHGIKGPSPLLQLKGFNLVWCLPPDYMHCVLEGVTQQITELWLTGAGTPFYIGRHIQEVENRIRDLKPPASFCRLPRPIGERKYWKATEWLYWLLFYALPCLKGVLQERYLTHFSLLCEAIFLLLQTSVSASDLQRADHLLSSFVNRVCVLYGESSATYNVHQLLHLSKSVEMLGPLWGTSTFPFENSNGLLVKLVTASKGVPLQIAERCIMKLWLNIAGSQHPLQSCLENMLQLHENE